MKLQRVHPKVTPTTRVHPVNGERIPWESPWQPGDMVKTWFADRNVGMVLSVDEDETLLVLWNDHTDSASRSFNPCGEVPL